MTEEEKQILTPLVGNLRALRKYWDDDKRRLLTKISAQFTKGVVADFNVTKECIEKEIEKARLSKSERRAKSLEVENKRRYENLEREKKETELARQERSNCGKCGHPANPEYGLNYQIIANRLPKSYIRCSECINTIQVCCPDCGITTEKTITIPTLKQLKRSNICEKCVKIRERRRHFEKRLSSFESKLANPDACIGKYPPGSKFKAKKPLFIDRLKNPPLEETPLDENGNMMRREYWPTKIRGELGQWTLERIVRINRLPRNVTGRKSKRVVYHRAWLTLLANYEKYILSNCKIVKVEIDRWKRMYENGYGYNYPIILHYHLLFTPDSNS